MPSLLVNDTYVKYAVAGKGYPIVFVHGAGFDSSTWRAQVAHFSKEYRVITPDTRGHGRSDLPDHDYSIADCVDDIRRLMSQIGVKKTHLVGISMGGNIALAFALTHPRNVKALVLAGVNGGSVAQHVRQKTEDKGLLSPSFSLEALLPTYRELFYSRSFWESHPDRIADWEKRFLGNSVEGFRMAVRANLSRPDLTDRLSEIRTPTLVIVGDQDAVTPPAMARALASRIPGSRMVVIPDCGHICNEEQPAAFNAAVDEFLKSGRCTIGRQINRLTVRPDSSGQQTGSSEQGYRTPSAPQVQAAVLV